MSAFIGPEIKISPAQTPTDADRYLPAVAYNSQHRQYLVVWHNQWSPSRDIYGQRLSSDGQLLGSWFSISSGANDRMVPAVAYNATDDEYLVVYMYDASTNGSRFDIMAQRVRWDGILIGSPFQIITYANRTFYSPRVVWKEAFDEYLIVWGVRDATTNVATDIGYKLIDHEGAVRFASIITADGQPSDPDVVWEPAFNRYLVVWTYTNMDGHTAIMGDLRDANANRVGSNPFVIYSSPTEDALRPRAASNGIYFLSVYEYAYSPSDHDIYGAWITNDASVILPINLVSSSTSETSPAVASRPGRNEVMVLFHRELSASHHEIGLHPISNTIPATDIPVCKWEYWDCFNPAGVWGTSGYELVYSAQAIIMPGAKVHVYGRLFYTNPAFIPMVLR